jgi:hypothetical protein
MFTPPAQGNFGCSYFIGVKRLPCEILFALISLGRSLFIRGEISVALISSGATSLTGARCSSSL